MVEDLQDIVNLLAAELHRGVAIDDERFRLLAHSPHHGPVDALRQQSILTRGISPASETWIRGLGVEDATGPMRVPANRDLGARGRVCAPVRYESRLLGFLFVTDPDGSMSEAEMVRCQQAADESAVLLHRARFLREAERSRERQLVLDAIGEDEQAARAATDAIVEEELMGAGPCVVLVLAAHGAEEGASGRDRDVELALALQSLRRMVPHACVAGLVRPGHACAIVAARELEREADEPLRLAHRLRDFAAERLAPLGAAALVGQGEPVEELAGVRRSHEQAELALRVAERVEGFGGVVDWATAGAYRMLVHVRAGGGDADLPAGLIRLLERPDLLETLETYLDLAGDARATAAALTLHRASLYYRLERIEQLAGIDLKRGEDRLAMHAGLKLLRLGALARANPPA